MKLFRLFLTIVIFSLSISQLSTLPSPKAYFSAIIVSDIDNSIEWYKKIFGFKIQHQMENQGRGFKQANLSLNDMALELIELSSALHPNELLKNEARNVKISGFFKFGFRVKKFDKWLEFLKDAKANIYGKVVNDTVSGKRMLLVLDPDGNRIQLFEE